MNNRNGLTRVGTAIITLLLLILVLGFMLFVFWDQLPVKHWLGMDDTSTHLTVETPTPTPAPTPGTTDIPVLTRAPISVVTQPPVQQEVPAAYVPPAYEATPNRTTYREGFYYESVADIPQLMERIRTLSYNEPINTNMGFDKLSYVRVKYVNFNDQDCDGEIICSKYIAQDLVEIFAALYDARYQIETIQLVDNFGANDDASMSANNTSAFNYRLTTGSQDDISEHSWGVCIDINPLYNPYVSGTVIQPASAAPYADRAADFPHKITEDDLCYQLFTDHGFEWGGHWNTIKDYQHFQKQIS